PQLRQTAEHLHQQRCGHDGYSRALVRPTLNVVYAPPPGQREQAGRLDGQRRREGTKRPEALRAEKVALKSVAVAVAVVRYVPMRGSCWLAASSTAPSPAPTTCSFVAYQNGTTAAKRPRKATR